MENCVEIKINGSFNNVYLPKLNELLYVIPAGVTTVFAFKMKNDNTLPRPTLKVVSGTAVFSNDSGSTVYGADGFTLPHVDFASYFKIVATTETVFSVSNCYSLDRATDMNAYLNSAVCVNVLLTIENLVTLSIDGQSYVGFDGISKGLPNLVTLFANQPTTLGGKSGDFSVLGKCKSLTTLALQNNTNVTGSIEDFAQTAITAGRTSGTCTITGNGIITYNSTAVANNTKKKITFSNGSYTVEDVA